VVEVAELDMFTKSDVNTLKRVITATTDSFRPPYERTSNDFKRRCVFVGTTNQDEYLMDETGNRRYWPVKISNIKLDEIKKQRDQLFAEAVHMFKQDNKWYQMPTLSEDEQASRVYQDPWTDIILNYVNQPERKWAGVTCTDIAVKCLEIDVGRIGRAETNRISKVLKIAKWKVHNTRKDGQSVKLFYPPDRPTTPPPEPPKQRELRNYAPEF
jgi:putative DNA primase/helicase